MTRLTLRTCRLLLTLAGLIAPLRADEPRVLLEVGRDSPETRMLSVCQVRSGRHAPPLLAVAGFTSNGRVDMADLAVYDVGAAETLLQWRLLRGGDEASSIRTLRSADLDGDGCEELVALGRHGHEDADSRGELQVFRHVDGQWLPAAAELWHSGRYTHGYGMDIGDINGDRRPEIATGGFFGDGNRESAVLRVWRFDDDQLSLVAVTSWKSEIGNTRINSVRIGDVSGDGTLEIVTAGRTGQVQLADEVNVQEADQLIVWRLEQSELVQLAIYDGVLDSRSRLRELRLADLDGHPGLELLVVGRRETPHSRGAGGGRGDGSGGGRGDGSGGGRRHAAEPAAVRPLFSVFQLQDRTLQQVADADFDDALGEVRDVAVVPENSGTQRILTITAGDLKPQRNAALDQWLWSDDTLQHVARSTASLGDETRARQLVVWKSPDATRILTIGFVDRNGQILGQILDWGAARKSASASQ